MEPTRDIRELQERIAMYEDMNAYKELYGSLFSRLYRFALTIVKSKEVAEEIVSDVFIKVWQLRDRLAEISNLRIYLYTITKNFSLNFITQNSKKTVMHLDALDLDVVLDVQGPLDQCISSDVIHQIRQAILHLPPKARIILQLVKEDGMKYKEVAEILGISVFTVRNQLALAVKKLADSLPPYLRTGIHQPDFFSRS